MRRAAVRLLECGMRDKDVRYLCDVADYFLREVAEDLTRAGKRTPARDGRARRGGGAPGVWTICQSRNVRREAGMFVTDWVLAELPFTKRPDPIAFHDVYRRYRRWGWRDDQRTPLAPSASLAIIRNISSGEITLTRCVICRHLSIHPGSQEPGGRGGGSCSFCNSAHQHTCRFTTDQRLLDPS